ncbi:hypothetical protein AB4865_09465 [Capnocytophaga sp. ARDL2]|uniref:hypothetical protein n=1 Tax=Capnocytophaga sp. ARDL2 TaxID=3238809 RepID=UPI003558F388
MENKNRKVVWLVSICFALYLFFSLLSVVFQWNFEPFNKVNLVAELFPNAIPSEEKETDKELVVAVNLPQQVFSLYQNSHTITNFYEGDSLVALPHFVEKLHTLKNTGKGKIRIAYLGDSMIEGDLISQTFRKLLQAEFGGNGVGYLPMFSNVSGYRQSATISASNWQDLSFKTKNQKNFYLSGHIFKGLGSGSYKDNTIAENSITEKIIIFGKSEGDVVEINGEKMTLQGKNLVNRKVISLDANNLIKVKSHSSKLPIYGVAFESENGVFVDNFSFRGITGVELDKLETDFLQAIQDNNPYDLVILQYGVNLLFRAKDTDYSYYEKLVSPAFSKIKKVFEKSDVLLVSVGDKAFRYSGEYKTAIGLPNLIELQAKLAFENGFSFYNQFQTMGGENTIVEWVKQKPALAAKDHTHPSAKGAEVLAQLLFDAVMKDYQKYQPKNQAK